MYIMYTMYRTCAKLLPSAYGRAIARWLLQWMQPDGAMGISPAMYMCYMYQPVIMPYTT